MPMRKLTVATSCLLLLVLAGCAKEDRAKRMSNETSTGANANRSDTGGPPSDSWIVIKTELGLLADPTTSGYETEVGAKDGVVTLTGKVENGDVKTAAERVARNIE